MRAEHIALESKTRGNKTGEALFRALLEEGFLSSLDSTGASCKCRCGIVLKLTRARNRKQDRSIQSFTASVWIQHWNGPTVDGIGAGSCRELKTSTVSTGYVILTEEVTN